MLLILAYAADILMILASAGAAAYCLILSRRLSKLTSFDQGIGGAIAVLSAQVDDMQSALAQAKAGSEGAGRTLETLVSQARDISGELELMIAACHDFAEEALVVQNTSPEAAAPDLSKHADQAAPPPAPQPPPEPAAQKPQLPVPDAGRPATAEPAEAETAVSDTSTDPQAATEAEAPVVAPVFGSRRSATTPVFHHRRSAGG